MPPTAEPELPPNPWREIEEVYLAALEDRSKGRRAEAIRKALHLARLLERADPGCEALLGMAGRCLIAELDGDPDEAIRYRRMELAGVKKLLDELDADLLRRIRMGPDDYSDRLDLLALNYLDAGRYDEALAALDESEAYCNTHGIPFDGNDIRADVRRAMRRKKARPAKAG